MEKNKINYTKLLFIVIITIGIIARLSYIGIYPLGLNQDEASSAYEAFSILNSLWTETEYLTLCILSLGEVGKIYYTLGCACRFLHCLEYPM